MNIGKLDRRITLQALTVTRDSWNHPTESWEDVATVWATKSPRRALEPTEADQVVALELVDWYIRHRGDVQAGTTRLLEGGAVYDIRGVQEIGRAQGLRLVTELRT